DSPGCPLRDAAPVEDPERSEGSLPVAGVKGNSRWIQHSWPEVRPRSRAEASACLRRLRVEEGQDDREQEIGATRQGRVARAGEDGKLGLGEGAEVTGYAAAEQFEYLQGVGGAFAVPIADYEEHR